MVANLQIACNRITKSEWIRPTWRATDRVKSAVAGARCNLAVNTYNA